MMHRDQSLEINALKEMLRELMLQREKIADENKLKEDNYLKQIEELQESLRIKNEALKQANYRAEFKRIYGRVSLLSPDEKNRLAVESYEKRVELLNHEILKLRTEVERKDFAIDLYDKDLGLCYEKIDTLEKLLENIKLAKTRLFVGEKITINGKVYVEVT